jgi:hypothetical protein
MSPPPSLRLVALSFVPFVSGIVGLGLWVDERAWALPPLPLLIGAQTVFLVGRINRIIRAMDDRHVWRLNPTRCTVSPDRARAQSWRC